MKPKKQPKEAVQEDDTSEEGTCFFDELIKSKDNKQK